MIRASAVAVGVAVLLAPGLAKADPPCGKGWRKHEPCGGYVYGPRPVVRPYVYYAPPPPVYYAPPPVYYPPPPVYYAPPVYAPAPGVSIGVNIPLR